MAIDELENVVRRYIEQIWNRGDLSALEDQTTRDFKYYLGGQPGRDRAAFGEFVAATRTAFPDWRVEIAEMISGDDAVAVRWHGRVTHLGPFRGMPATGRTITVTGINIYDVRDGRVAAEWEQMDSLGMLQQMGALPAK